MQDIQTCYISEDAISVGIYLDGTYLMYKGKTIAYKPHPRNTEENSIRVIKGEFILGSLN